MTKKIKPVKAWGIVTKQGKILREVWVNKTEPDLIEGDELIRVLITPIKK